MSDNWESDPSSPVWQNMRDGSEGMPAEPAPAPEYNWTKDPAVWQRMDAESPESRGGAEGSAVLGLIQDAQIPASTVAEVLRYIEKGSEHSQAELDEFDKMHAAEARAELLATWGDQETYDRNIDKLTTLVAGLPEHAADAIWLGRTSDGRAVLNNPALVQRLLAAASRPGPKGDGQSVKVELAKIRDFQAKNPRAYFRDEAMLARERELIAMDMANGKN